MLYLILSVATLCLLLAIIGYSQWRHQADLHALTADSTTRTAVERPNPYLGEEPPQRPCCVVCGARLKDGSVFFKNEWEASLKNLACCSSTCALEQDAVSHWMPATAPEPVAYAEGQRLIKALRRRLNEGGKPSPLVRESLVAGVGSIDVRHALEEVYRGMAFVDEERRSARVAITAMAAMRLAVVPFISLAQNGDRTSGLPDGISDIEAWEDRFGVSAST